MKKRIIALGMAVALFALSGCSIVDIESAASKLDQEFDVDEIGSILNFTQCWIACANDKAMIIYVNGEESDLVVVECDDSGNVSTSGSDFSIYSSAQEGRELNWNITAEDDVICADVTGEGIDAAFYQVNASTRDEAVELAKKYIINRSDKKESILRKMSNISDVLDDYTGTSIVNAFIKNGIEPSFKNRKIFAEKAGIENYEGTAEQNLYLIEYMGGKIN